MAPTPRSGGAARPAPRGFLRGWQPQHPPAGAPPCTRVTFPSRGKSPKARQGLRPLESPEGDRAKSVSLFAPAPPAASRNPLDRVSASNPDRFATLRWVGESVFFSPGGIAEGTPSAFRPWRGGRTNWRLAGVVITICSHRYDTFTVTNDQTLSPYLYYYHYLFYIKRVSFVTVSQQMAYLCGLLLILGVIPA